MEKQGKLFAGIVGGVTMFVLLAGIAGLFAAGPWERSLSDGRH